MLRGTPFLYAGEELGLLDADVPEHQRQDPAGYRDGCRAPIPWDASRSHGWVDHDNWLPFPPDSLDLCAEALRNDPDSITSLYRDLLALRRSEPALRLGDQRVRDDLPDEVVAWERTRGDSRFLIAINMTSTEVDLDTEDEWDLAISSAPGVEIWEATLPPQTAVVLHAKD
jgi:alpha-glucosidase